MVTGAEVGARLPGGQARRRERIDAGSKNARIRLGVVGMSEGNGHPFSFSAIVNGYDDAALARGGWPVIHEYVAKRPDGDFGFPDVKITHAWTQDPAVTRALAASCLIPNAAGRPEDLIGRVDAVLIARDDEERHAELALPFLRAGLAVFVDKPLCLSAEGLAALKPYLEKGSLMSSSGMRYAAELDGARASIGDYGPLKLIRGTIVNDWERYGIHLVDAVRSVVSARPVSVRANDCGHDSMAVSMSDGSLLEIDALGRAGRVFRVEFLGERRSTVHEIGDNFTMFRRMIADFLKMAAEGRPAIPPELTLSNMRLLMAGRLSRAQKRSVKLDEIGI